MGISPIMNDKDLFTWKVKTGKQVEDRLRQIDSHSDRQKDIQTDRQAGRQTDRQTDRKTLNVVYYMFQPCWFFGSRGEQNIIRHGPWCYLSRHVWFVFGSVSNNRSLQIIPQFGPPWAQGKKKTIFLLWLLVIFAQMHDNEIHALWKYPNCELIIIIIIIITITINKYFNRITLQYKSTVISGVL